ncbi:MAG: hypothetical protein KDA84_11280 [Planctomycetaceae bacterium]|nr:hypothetical protein [Planctomycetaceae bacterium]
MWLIPLILMAEPSAGETFHLQQNPVYEELRESGVAVTSDKQIKLPEPYMQDGLDADAQRKLVEKLGGRRYRWDLLTRNSTVAPQIIQLSDETLPETDTKVRRLDVYFVAYGDLKAISKSKNLTEPSNDGGQEWKPLTADDLTKETFDKLDSEHETFGWISNDLIDRVRVSGVLHTHWSLTDHSLIASAVLDPRFDRGEKLPNIWQPLTRGRKGWEAGESSPYSGAGGYTKITKLEKPDGALFVESHLVFAEPYGWFKGTNLLSSKLPAVVQNEVRSTRREILQASRSK